MSQQVNVNIRMDRDLKENADMLFSRMGLNMTTAVNTFVKQCLREESIPFQIKPFDNYMESQYKRNITFASEKALSKEWLSTEEDYAWADL